MWKALSRSVCEVVERRVGFTALRTDVSKGKTPGSSECSKIPCPGENLNIITHFRTYCPLKHLRAKQKDTSNGHSGAKQQKTKNHARWNDPPINACLGAMGWSSALVLGWYLSQPLGRHIFGDSHLKEIRLHSPPYYFKSGGTVYAQSPVQPLGIRPLTHSSSVDGETSNADSFHSSATSSLGEADDFFTQQRGPYTPEEALDEVSRVFEAASRAFSGDVENKLGMVCMAKGQHSEAMKHFRRASYHENAVAAYNLGQCYELGLGTVRSLKKAAKWYKISSDRGHPTAMYNLAVFLANGWGGLRVDHNRARELLMLAANLGLREAKEALMSMKADMYASDSQHTSEDSVRRKDSTEEFLELIGATAKREVERPNKYNAAKTHLSHLDWLDLSSSSSGSVPNSDDIFSNTEESHLYSGLCLESNWSLSSTNLGKVVELRHKNGDIVYYLMDSTGSDSLGGESLDEAANCRP